MKYTNNQIKEILNIQEFVATSNTLSRIYVDYENKEFIIDTLTDRERIYKVYCSSIYNLIKAIQDSKEYFINTKKYDEFVRMVNQQYVANDNKYYSKENYKASLFKIIETIRHQSNHVKKEKSNVKDDNVLFEAYIDFDILEQLRIVINEIFNEIYEKIDKGKIKEIVLNKPKIKYSFDKLSNKIDELKLRIPEEENKLKEVLKKDSIRNFELFDELFNADNLYDLYSKDPKAIKRLLEADKELQESSQKVEEYISKKGTKLEKEAFKLLKEFSIEKEGDSIKNTNNNIKELQERLSELVESYNKNENN